MSKEIVFVHPGEETCTQSRMKKGVDIYKQRGGLKMALSETLGQYARDSGIPESDIFFLPPARSTIEEMYFLRENVLKPYNLHGGYLVSCGEHGSRIEKIASVELEGYDCKFIPAEEHGCKITSGGREFLAKSLDSMILMMCKIYDRPDIYQTLKELGPKWVYNQVRKLR